MSVLRSMNDWLSIALTLTVIWGVGIPLPAFGADAGLTVCGDIAGPPVDWLTVGIADCRVALIDMGAGGR